MCIAAWEVWQGRWVAKRSREQQIPALELLSAGLLGSKHAVHALQGARAVFLLCELSESGRRSMAVQRRQSWRRRLERCATCADSAAPPVPCSPLLVSSIRASPLLATVLLSPRMP